MSAPRVQILKGEVFERMGRVRNSVSQGSWEVNTDFGLCGAFRILFHDSGDGVEGSFLHGVFHIVLALCFVHIGISSFD